jgi:hypothetical protein
MFIPLEGEDIICLADVVAVYKEDGGTTILHADGSKTRSSLSPETLARRLDSLFGRQSPSLRN